MMMIHQVWTQHLVWIEQSDNLGTAIAPPRRGAIGAEPGLLVKMSGKEHPRVTSYDAGTQ
jgi:hypothetical protein